MFRLFSRHWSIPSAVCLVVEAGILLLAVWLAYQIRFFNEEVVFYSSGLRTAIFVVVFIYHLYLTGLYDFDERRDTREVLTRLTRAALFSAATLAIIYFATYERLTVGRGTFLIALGVSTLLIGAWRLVLQRGLRARFFGERILIVGADDAAVRMAAELLKRKHLGYKVLGFLCDDPKLQGVSLINPRVIGTTGDALYLARAHGATRIVVAQNEYRGMLNMNSLLECKTSGVPVERGDAYFEQLTGKIMAESLRKSWLIFSDGFLVKTSTLFFKRSLDIVVASLGLLIASPIILVTAIAIRVSSKGPALFRQTRVGRNGKVFTLYKFRSMRQDAEAATGAVWAQQNDVRVTRVGQFIRKVRIDEIPQLWNVLVGGMSMVGPRPERPEFVEQLKERYPLYSQRLVVRPGITGWAQVKAPYAASIEDSFEKLKYDLYYVKNISFFLDVTILASTARTVLQGSGAR